MITLRKDFFEQIVKQCKQEYPNEACGILAGKNGRVNGQHSRTVEKIYEMINLEKSPSFFSMSPEEQFKVNKDIRNLGFEMIGVYHSHFKRQAYPSSEDVQLAFYPEVSYLILSLQDMDNPVIRSFKIEEGKVKEEKVVIGGG
jgi:proteasome lid subunit RPN8/RPN11